MSDELPDGMRDRFPPFLREVLNSPGGRARMVDIVQRQKPDEIFRFVRDHAQAAHESPSRQWARGLFFEAKTLWD
jgi:hypothetical protein